MSGGNAVFVSPGMNSRNILRLDPIAVGLRVRVERRDGISSEEVLLQPEHEQLLLNFLLMRAPRPPMPVAVEPKPDSPKSGGAYWTPERRAAQGEKMRAIRLARLAKKAATP